MVIEKPKLIGNISVIKAEHLWNFLEIKNPNVNPRFKDIAKFYIEVGEKYGIRGDVAFCQMAHETGWLKFGGSVKEEQNNFCGLGSTGTGVKGAYFNTVKDGVTAQIQHLFAYCTPKSVPLPAGEVQIDPRYHLVMRGVATYPEDLNGRWAVPGKTYGQSIISIYNTIYEYAVNNPIEEPEKPIEPEVPVQPDDRDELIKKLQNDIKELSIDKELLGKELQETVDQLNEFKARCVALEERNLILEQKQSQATVLADDAQDNILKLMDLLSK